MVLIFFYFGLMLTVARMKGITYTVHDKRHMFSLRNLQQQTKNTNLISFFLMEIISSLYLIGQGIRAKQKSEIEKGKLVPQKWADSSHYATTHDMDGVDRLPYHATRLRCTSLLAPINLYVYAIRAPSSRFYLYLPHGSKKHQPLQDLHIVNTRIFIFMVSFDYVQQQQKNST